MVYYLSFEHLEVVYILSFDHLEVVYSLFGLLEEFSHNLSGYTSDIGQVVLEKKNKDSVPFQSIHKNLPRPPKVDYNQDCLVKTRRLVKEVIWSLPAGGTLNHI